MKDIMGVELQVGDVVAFNPPSYKGLIMGKIIAFTPKMVRVSYKYSSEVSTSTVVYPSDVVKKV